MIRKATIEDLPRMEECAREFRATSRIVGQQAFDMRCFIALWENLISSGIGVIFLAANEDGAVQGALGAVAHPDPYSGSLAASEFFWFVRESARGTAGIRLYRAFEGWALDKGCSAIRIVHMVDSMPEKLDRVYKAWGYKPMEVHYQKELQQKELQPCQ